MSRNKSDVIEGKRVKTILSGLFILAAATMVCAQSAETSSTAAGQAIADALRESTGAEIAFLPAAALKLNASSNPLVDHLLYPTDEVSVVALKGSQVRAALERSAGIFPTPNSGFLQLSGLNVTADSGQPQGKRIQSIRTETGPLGEGAVYRVISVGLEVLRSYRKCI